MSIAAPAYAFAVTFALLRLMQLVMPLRVSERQESIGLDVIEHGEEAYASGEGAILVSTEARIAAPVPVAETR